MDDKGSVIVKRINDVLKDLKKQRKEFCLAVGIANNTLRTWEVRDSDPSAKVLLRIADYLGVSVRWLLTGKDERSFSRDERNLLAKYQCLTEENQRVIHAAMDAMLSVPDTR
ncbi:MAG: helix-turn-helix domain-containing protein [Spirochaetaceae bacterium]|jgi:transcriptional regulator with XRE-family HTH domain|nr:helix-turn-helix domain-containing protein [Spirochaetaceae bacterium]